MYECKQQRVFIDVVVSPLWNAVTALTDWREPLDHLDENKAASPFCPMLIKEKLRTNLGKQRITPGPYLLRKVEVLGLQCAPGAPVTSLII